MKLNRNNYEEYFILYLDNELDGEGRREVEAFAKQNPDLKAELHLLMHSKLTPDAEISFTEKGSLMRFDSSSISLSNYEEWLTSYIDNELTEGERRDVEVFVAGNPAIQRQLNLLQLAKLQPETVVFPYKESLYRKEVKARIVAVRWWRIAAAAVLLLGISTVAVVLINNKKGHEAGGLVINSSNEKVLKTTDSIKQPDNASNPNEQIVSVAGKKKDDNNIKEKSNQIAIKTANKSDQKKQPNVEKNAESVVKNNDEQKSTNIPITAGDNSNARKDVIASTAGSDKSLTVPKVISDGSDVTTRPGDSSNISDGSVNQIKNSDIVYASQNGNNQKGGIRGFLRKVTRTIEKRTNIKATDDDDRLLVAGLAIKL